MTPQETLKIGSIGKDIVMDCLRDAGYIVTDMRDAPDGTPCIDCHITDPKLGQTWSIFIVTDIRMGETANLFVERYIQRLDHKTGARRMEHGWLYTCKADIIAFLDGLNSIVRLYDWTELRQIAMKADIGANRSFYDPVDRGSVVLSYIVPFADLETYVTPDEYTEPDDSDEIRVIHHAKAYLGCYTDVDTTRLRKVALRTRLPF